MNFSDNSYASGRRITLLRLLIDLVWFTVKNAFDLMVCSGILYFELKIQKKNTASILHKVFKHFHKKYLKYYLKLLSRCSILKSILNTSANVFPRL